VDPLAPLLDLPGVADAVATTRDALVPVHNHKVNRRGFPATAAEAALRAARASAALEGAPLVPVREEHVTHPVLAGAVRVADEGGKLVGVWKAAPLQALARLHVLAATDLAPSDTLGRPREGASARLGMLADLLTGGTSVPAPVLVAVVHGELLALRPFGTADAVVARAAARLTAVSTGLDPKALAVPEVGHLRRAAEYRAAAVAFATGSPDGLREWIVHVCAAWQVGAREGMSIAEARSDPTR
jgi:hypothetical protein